MTTETTNTSTPTREQAELAVEAVLSTTAHPTDNLVTRVEVAEYVAWRERFDEMQARSGTTAAAHLRVFYNIEDETSLAILADSSDGHSGKAWAQGEWRAALPSANLETPPVTYFGSRPNEVHASAKLGAHFRVNDYPRWHQLFKEMEESRVRSRITDPDVFRSSEDGSDILVLWNIASTQLVRSWMVEDLMTGYPAATGAGGATVRFFEDLSSDAKKESDRGN